MWQEDVGTLALDIHDYFTRTPLATTEEEGFDHWLEFFETLMEPYSTGDYRNYN